MLTIIIVLQRMSEACLLRHTYGVESSQLVHAAPCLAMQQNGYRLRLYIARAKWFLTLREMNSAKIELKNALDLSKDLPVTDGRGVGVRSGMIPVLRVRPTARESHAGNLVPIHFHSYMQPCSL